MILLTAPMARRLYILLDYEQDTQAHHSTRRGRMCYDYMNIMLEVYSSMNEEDSMSTTERVWYNLD